MRISAGWNSLSAPATEQIKEDYNPGEIGFDPLGLLPTDEDAKFEIQTKEINNGRLAMISIGAPLQPRKPRKRAQPPQPQRSFLTPARSAAQLASRCRRRLTTSPSGAVRVAARTSARGVLYQACGSRAPTFYSLAGLVEEKIIPAEDANLLPF